jgi:hypothetical protein
LEGLGGIQGAAGRGCWMMTSERKQDLGTWWQTAKSIASLWPRRRHITLGSRAVHEVEDKKAKAGFRGERGDAQRVVKRRRRGGSTGAVQRTAPDTDWSRRSARVRGSAPLGEGVHASRVGYKYVELERWSE